MLHYKLVENQQFEDQEIIQLLDMINDSEEKLKN